MVELIFWALSLLICLGVSVWLAKGILIAIFHAVSLGEAVNQRVVRLAVETSDARLDHTLELVKR